MFHRKRQRKTNMKLHRRTQHRNTQCGVAEAKTAGISALYIVAAAPRRTGQERRRRRRRTGGQEETGSVVSADKATSLTLSTQPPHRLSHIHTSYVYIYIYVYIYAVYNVPS